MNQKILQRIIIGLISFILFVGIILVIIDYKDPKFDAIAYLSGWSTFVLAILTAIYVITTSGQLNIMKKQLDEMRKERELQCQPLPWFEQIKFYIIKPKLFYSPPEKLHKFLSKYDIGFTLKNIGTFPAICIDISSRIEIPRDNDFIFIDTISKRIDALEEKANYPPDGSLNKSFSFTEDASTIGKVLEALRDNNIEKYPRIMIRILYKNVLGGCFILFNEYVIYPKDENQDSVMKNWLSEIKAFNIKYKNEIDQLTEIRNYNREKWDILFEELKSQIACTLVGEDEIELSVFPIPNSLKVVPISYEDYKSILSDVSYGKIIPWKGVICK